MGACLRGTESLVLMLPGFIWKKLTGEKVQWSTDFSTVDSAEVDIQGKTTTPFKNQLHQILD